MKKIKEPNPQVIKFESMDVIATSGEKEIKKITSSGESASRGFTIQWITSGN